MAHNHSSEERGMPGYTDKSRRYLRLSVENDKRATSTNNPELKLNFLQIAVLYRNLANFARLESEGFPTACQ